MVKRFDYIDIAKGIGILMVVWAHILLTGASHQFIYAFHMPVFFLLSGMMFSRDKYSSFGAFLGKRAKRLLIPYVIYSILTWGVWAISRFIRHDEVDSYWMPLLQTVIAQGSGAYIVHNSALWFVPCLFLTEMMYFFISRLGNWWTLAACFVCAAYSFELGAVYAADYWFLLPWNADAALIALPFYCVGNMIGSQLGHQRIIESAQQYIGWYLASFVGLTVVLFWSAMAFGECSMGSSSYQCPSGVFLARAFVGSAWLLCLSLLLGMLKVENQVVATFKDLLKWAGKSSLDIMCLHIPAKGVCMIVVAALVGITVDDISMSLLWSGVSFIVTMLAVWVAMKFVPVNKMSQSILKQL